jgi:leucine dehydrogenase
MEGRRMADYRKHPEFDAHEQVVIRHDLASGLRAIIAVHNTSRGPALGGCRMWPYRGEAEALTDALRLAKGMTYKSALADLPLGGGKAVIIGDPRRDKSRELLLAMATFIDSFEGRYITAEDSGTSVADMQIIGTRTPWAAGMCDEGPHGGDPSPATAYGTFVGLKAAVAHRFGAADLAGLRVAIQGVGNVGFHLAKHLSEAGATLFVADVFEDNRTRAVEMLGANPVTVDAIYDLDVDVFSPCAMGAVINDETLDRLKAPVIAGAANNQLATPCHGDRLQKRGTLYAPDYALNAGGIIDIAYQRQGGSREDMLAHVARIADTLTEIFERADAEGEPTYRVADQLAEERFSRVETAISLAS